MAHNLWCMVHMDHMDRMDHMDHMDHMDRMDHMDHMDRMVYTYGLTSKLEPTFRQQIRNQTKQGPEVQGEA